MKEKAFITGSTGFIGSVLTGRLLKSNYNVIALVRNQSDVVEGVVPIIGDILKPETYSHYLDDCSVVFHCAAYINFQKKFFKKAYETNVEGTRNVIEQSFIKGVRKFVHLSACAVLGYSHRHDDIIDESSNPAISASNVYAYTKKKAEDVALEYAEKGLDVSIANIATVYGYGDKHLNSGSIIKTIYNGGLKFVPPGGTSFVSVDDLADGLMLLAEKGQKGQRYIFCTENIDYFTLVQRISRVLGVNQERRLLPGITYYPALVAVKGLELLSKGSGKSVNLLTTQILQETYNFKYYSSGKSRELLGWKPRQSLEDAVGDALSYYKDNGLL